MKRSLLLLFLFTSVSVLGQNIQDRTVTFRYTQLPVLVLDKGKQFNMEVQMNYMQRNEDSTKAYEQAKSLYMVQVEAYMDVWEQQKAQVDKQYLVTMVEWEKQVAAGNTTATRPVKPPYPSLSLPDRPKPPFLLQEINAAGVVAGAKIEGLTMNTSAPTKILLVFDGFEKGMIKQNTKGTGATAKHEFLIHYRHPVTVKIEMPGKGVVVNQRIPDTESFRVWKTKEFASKSEFDLWWYDNEKTIWEERQQQVVFENMDLINNWLSNQYGFPVKTRRVDIYSVKSNKDHDYSDYQTAQTIMESALLMISYPDQKAQANAKLREAIAIWENALKESNITDRKARIDKTVTPATYINVAEAYLWLSDFSAAEIAANKAINVGVNKYERDGRALLEFIRDQKMRFMANQ